MAASYNPANMTKNQNRQKQWRTLIDRFIPENTPLGRGDEVSMLLRATGGSYRGAATLASIARKESSFGSSAFTPNNFWGYGIHAGPSISHAPTVEAMATRVWKALSDPKGLYRGQGLNTLPQVLNKYAPPSENNTALYTQQTSDWMKSMGFNPNVNLFSGNTSQPAGVPASPQTVQQSGAYSIPLDFTKLQQYGQANTKDILAGRTPDTKRLTQMIALIQKSLPVASPGGASTGGVNPPAVAQPSPKGGAFNGTYGFSTGAVDSGKAMAGGVGGNWGGSEPRALALARAVGVTPSSQKRSRKLTASGNPSDHWIGMTSSYATDLPTSGSAGDKLYKKVMVYLAQLSGNPELAKVASGSWHNLNIGGYRYQVGWRVPEHYDHVHVGVRKL